MAAEEEFDFSSGDENFDNDWKFDENNDISECINASATPLSASANKDMIDVKNDTKIVAECHSNEQKVSLMDLNTAKAGMEGLDKEKINQVIHEASKGSKFYENEKKKEKQVQKRIEELQRKLASFSDEQKIKAKQDANKIAQDLEQGRDLTRTIVHIDMDAFYAAVEMRDDPSLKVKPMAVGGSAMLCTSNYLARRFGVRAGMPGFIAKKLCPNLTIVHTNFDKYTKISHEIREVLGEYDRNFLPMSLDEAYLDITEYLSTLNNIKDGSEEGSLMEKVKNEEIGESLITWEHKLTKLENTNAQETTTEMNANDKGERDTVKAVGSMKIEHEIGNIDTNMEPMSINEYYTKEKGNLKDAGSMTVIQEAGKIEAMPYDFKEVSMNEKIETEGKPNERKQESVAYLQHPDGEQDMGKPVEIAKCERDEDLCENENNRAQQLQDEISVDQEMFYNKVEEVVNEMRRKIEEKTQLTASAGIAPNMFLAKVCSDKNKPNGQFYLKPETDKIMDFVRELPLRKAFGIGRVSEQILTSVLKVNTCFELYGRRDLMQLLFTPNACRNYLEISLGLGSTVVDVDRERKSMSTETTFREINKPEEHFSKCRELCLELSNSLKEKGLTARKVGIKLKTVNFEVKTRVRTASFPLQEADEIFPHAKSLLVNEIRACSPEPLRLRLMGVRAAELCEKGFVNESKQPTIISLMKKSAKLNSPRGGPSKLSAPEQDDGVLKCGPVNMPDEAGSSEFGCEGMGLADHPTTSKRFTDDHSSLGQQRLQSLDENIKMEASRPVDVDGSEKEPNTFNCPVCGKDLTFKTGNALVQMNQHVDMCLRKQVNQGILKYDSGQQTSKGKQTSKKRKRESTNNPNRTVKRKPMDRFLTKHAK